MSATDTNETAEVVQLPAVSRHFVVSADVFSDPASFEHAQRVAKVFASSNLVPPHLKGQVADCLIAYQIARRLNEEPLTVFQNIYVVSGRPGWKTEYVIARANKAGVFKDRITWEPAGEGDTLAVTAHATLADSGKKIKVTCDMKMARAENWTKNAKYTSMPEHMLRWRSAAMLIRLYAPEVMLGMPVIEELETLPPTQMRDVSQASLAEKLDALAELAPPIAEHVDAETGEITEKTNSAAANIALDNRAAEAGSESPGPAANSSSTQKDAAAASSDATGQAAAESAPPRDKAAAAATDKTTPKTEKEYVDLTAAWINALDDADDGEARWKAEKNLRNKSNVGAEARENLQEHLAQKCKEIRDADRS